MNSKQIAERKRDLMRELGELTYSTEIVKNRIDTIKQEVANLDSLVPAIVKMEEAIKNETNTVSD